MKTPLRLRTVRATFVAGVAVLVLTASGGWLALVGPVTGDLDEEGTRLTEARDANQFLAQQVRTLEAQRDDLADLDAGSARLARLFPPTADQPGFFALIDAAARQAGISPRDLTTLSPTAPTPVTLGEDGAPLVAPDPEATPPAEEAAAPELAVQTVTLTVETSYDRTVAFVAALERMDRSFFVRSLSSSLEEETGTVVTTVTGSTFVAPPVLLLDPEQPAKSPAAPGDTQASG